MPRLLLLPLLVFTGCGGTMFPWPLEEGAQRHHVASTAAVSTINQGYDRRHAKVMVRSIAVPTRANLDSAAYLANVVLHRDEDDFRPQQLDQLPAAQRFAGALDTLSASVSGTPLTSEELAQPLALAPLIAYLAKKERSLASPLEAAHAAVRGEAWGQKLRPGTYYQQIVALYLHRAKGGVECWVKIEFESWAKLFPQMPDEDGDGYPEIYARLKKGLAPAALKALREDYLTRRLSAKEVQTWAQELASYWYPSYNTDIVQLKGATSFPLKATEAAVKEELAGATIKEPLVVMRGKPHGRPIYNVFVVPGIKSAAMAPSSKAKLPADHSALKRFKVAPAPEATIENVRRDLLQNGGTWKAWLSRYDKARRALGRKLKARPKRLAALIGRDGFLFYRKSLDYLLGGDIQKQPKGKDPLPTIVAFKEQLARIGVDFLVVPVPTKAEVFPDKLGIRGATSASLVHPHGRKFLLELAKAGVEVVDLLPLLLAERGLRKGKMQPLYQPQDTHWTDRGLRVAAGAIGRRIARYDWYNELKKRAVSYRQKRVTFKQYGDLHSRLTAKEQRLFSPPKLIGHQVLTPAGKPLEDDETSPIVILGDSFTGVFQRTLCRHAGVSAHIAKTIGHPVDLVMSWGGGPNVRKKLLERKLSRLKKMRLLVWIFAARDFHNYWEDWQRLPLPKQ